MLRYEIEEVTDKIIDFLMHTIILEILIGKRFDQKGEKDREYSSFQDIFLGKETRRQTRPGIKGCTKKFFFFNKEYLEEISLEVM